MDEFKLKRLLARHSTMEMDKLELTRRIQSEHLFTSVDECFRYLYCIVMKTPIDKDNSIFINYKDNPILVINVIDETICSIVYEIYHQIYRNDNEMIGYIRSQITDFYNDLLNIVDDMSSSDAEYKYYRQLLVVMSIIKKIATPESHKEEDIFEIFSIAYYLLMFILYNNARPRDEYFIKNEKYYEELCYR